MVRAVFLKLGHVLIDRSGSIRVVIGGLSGFVVGSHAVDIEWLLNHSLHVLISLDFVLRLLVSLLFLREFVADMDTGVTLSVDLLVQVNVRGLDQRTEVLVRLDLEWTIS